MKKLELKKFYSRKDIHSIFSPDTKFTPQAGTWGLQGIIPIPSKQNDFVFIVTYGASQGGHSFDEGITEEGVFSWQSQPSNSFKDKRIQQLIAHNELTNNIYLFLRDNKKSDYEYLGKLGYLTHDKEREKPVYFQWQLLDWHEEDFSENSNTNDSSKPIIPPAKNSLRESYELPAKKREGATKEAFRARKSPDYAAKDAKNRQLGLEGELLVLEFEKLKLREKGCDDLAEKVVHTSVIQGDGAGYDIKSFDENGNIKYIEVKTTAGSLDTDFYMSPNEIKFSECNAKNFYLYRVYEMGNQTSQAKFYQLHGDILEKLIATPVNYKMSFRE